MKYFCLQNNKYSNQFIPETFETEGTPLSASLWHSQLQPTSGRVMLRLRQPHNMTIVCRASQQET